MLLLFALLQAIGITAVFYVTTCLLSRSHTWLAPYIALALLVIVGFIGFWATYTYPVAAMILNMTFWVMAAVAVVTLWRLPFNGEAATGGAIWAIGSVALILAAFGPTGLDKMTDVARTRFSHELPVDNIIPLLFANALTSGHVPIPLIGDWLSSDRPPLQTGMFLVLRIPLINGDVAYQLLATTIQMTVLPATYFLVRSFNASRVAGVIAAGLVFFAPITIINGVFVWPKLITAALLMVATAIHLGPAYQTVRGSRMAGTTVGVALAGAMLSHGAAAFTIIAFGVVSIFSARWGSLRYSLAVALTAFALYAPWMAYQHFIDSPGDRLIKWHLAGVIDATDKRAPLKAMRDAYRGMTLSDVSSRLQLKIGKSLESVVPFTQPDRAKARATAFFKLLPSLGVVGAFGLAIVAAGFIFGYAPLAAVIVVNYLFWCITIFDTEGAIVHQSSYFMLLAIPALLAIMLSRQTIALTCLLASQAALAWSYFH